MRSGSADKGTGRQVIEWFINLLVVVGCSAGVTIAMTYFLQRRGEVFGFLVIFPIIIILFVSTFVTGLMLIARTVGIVMMVVSPEHEAFDFVIDREQLIIQVKGRAPVTYGLTDVSRILLMETSRSVLIHSVKGSDSYRLSMSLSYKQSEAKIDAINDPPIFKKERQFLETNAKDIDPRKSTEGVTRTTRVGRRVYEIDPAHAKEVIVYTRI